MKLTNIFTNERAEIRKTVADAGEALKRALKKTKIFLADKQVKEANNEAELTTAVREKVAAEFDLPVSVLENVGRSAVQATVAMQKLTESLQPYKIPQTVPPRLMYLATRHKKARVRKKNQKRIRKMMYGGKK